MNVDERPVQRSDQRRNDELILRAAARLLAADPGASLQAVADAAGLSRPTVYRRYPTREALATGIRSAAAADMMLALDAVQSWETGTEAFRSLLRSLVALGRRYPIVLARHRIGPADGRAPVDERIVEILTAGQRAGVLRDDLDADLLNASLFGVMATVVPLYPAVATDVVADQIFGLLIDGMAANDR